MEEFYSLLRSYNLELNYSILPQWAKIYTEPTPPTYWLQVAEILNQYPKSYSIFEIGSGLGDVLALSSFLGFGKVQGIEQDELLTETANDKLLKMFELNNAVLQGKYPIRTAEVDILLQVNCIYIDEIHNKTDFLKRLVYFYENAQPKHYFVEVIDSSFKEPLRVFPDFVRLSEYDMQKAFSGLNIQSFLTYQYPKNTSTKRLYVISK